MRDFFKKVVSFAKSHPIVLGSILVAGAIGAGVYAWGPSRATFTMEKPADYITFNSITNNPVIGGDERDFVGIREKGTQNAWSNNVKIQSGKEYYVRMYVHNNAAANLNLVAENVTAKMNVPNNTAKSITVDGLISSSNAKPNQVWDNATFTSDTNFNLTYVSGSALYENNSVGSKAKGGAKLSDSIVTNTGALLGYDKLDGRIPGCMQYAGYVTILVKANSVEPASSIDIAKTVRKIGGEKVWSETVNANSGDTVEFQIDAKNSGSATINNLVIRDILPSGLEYIAGSAKLYNANNQFKGSPMDNTLVTNTGANVGAYSAGSNAVVRFRAKVVENSKLPVCGENVLTNLAQASDQKIVKNDTASVKVTKTCEPPKTPEYKCTGLSVAKLSRTKFEFNTNYTVKNTTFTGVKYVIKDASGKIVAQKTVAGGTKFTFESNQPGKYTVVSTVITANGENTNANCQKEFVIEEAPKALKCDATTISKISRTKIEISTSYTQQNITNVVVKYEIKDKSGKIVKTFENNGSKFQIEITQPGTYTVIAKVVGDGKTSNCEKTFAIEETPKVKTPEIKIEKTVNGKKDLTVAENTDFTYEIVIRNTGEVDLKDAKITDKAPANVKFISADKGEVKDNVLTYTVPSLKVGESATVKIVAQATASNMKAKNVACVNTPTIPGDNDGCDSANIEVPKKSDPTPPTPTTPPVPTTPSELPQTGIDGIGAIVAISSLTAASAYYIASRKLI